MSVYKVKPELTGEGTDIYPVVINKSDTDIYTKSEGALTGGKPILWYETNTECYYIDTATLSGTDIVLTKGGKTITIESDGTIIEVGDIQEKIHEYIINLELNSSPDGEGDSLNVYFRYTTNRELPLYINEPLTQEIANSVVDNYYYILLCEDEAEIIQYAVNNKFVNNILDVRGTNNEFCIVNDSKITIEKLF